MQKSNMNVHREGPCHYSQLDMSLFILLEKEKKGICHGGKNQRMSMEKIWDCHMFALPLVEFQFHFQILVKLLILRHGKAAHMTMCIV